jgi:hypothetical protein
MRNDYECFPRCCLSSIVFSVYATSCSWMILSGGLFQDLIMKDPTKAQLCFSITADTGYRNVFWEGFGNAIIALIVGVCAAEVIKCFVEERVDDFDKMISLYVLIWPFLVISFIHQDQAKSTVHADLYLCQALGAAFIALTIMSMYASYKTTMVFRKLYSTVMINTCQHLSRTCVELFSRHENHLATVSVVPRNDDSVAIDIVETNSLHISLCEIEQAEMNNHMMKKLQDENAICVITQSFLKDSDKIIQVDNCRHLFGALELLKWLQENASCPLCKRSIEDSSALTLFQVERKKVIASTEGVIPEL